MKKVIRILIYIIGLGILSLGVVLNAKTGLGVSAINSIPYVISTITGTTLGNNTIIVYVIYIIIQFILIGKNVKWIVLLQLPCTILFGKYTDFFNQRILIEPTSLYVSFLLLAAAIILTALGVVLTINMRIVPNAPDGLVQEFAIKIKKDFGFAKNVFDIFCILVSLTISLIIERRVIGIGIGTVLSAIFIGRVIALLNKIGKEKLLTLSE